MERGQLIAGPFCGETLGAFGPDFIEVKTTGTGDPLQVAHAAGRHVRLDRGGELTMK